MRKLLLGFGWESNTFNLQASHDFILNKIFPFDAFNFHFCHLPKKNLISISDTFEREFIQSFRSSMIESISKKCYITCTHCCHFEIVQNGTCVWAATLCIGRCGSLHKRINSYRLHFFVASATSFNIFCSHWNIFTNLVINLQINHLCIRQNSTDNHFTENKKELRTKRISNKKYNFHWIG